MISSRGAPETMATGPAAAGADEPAYWHLGTRAAKLSARGKDTAGRLASTSSVISVASLGGSSPASTSVDLERAHASSKPRYFCQ